MKIRSVVTLVGLAINFALLTFAQQKNTTDQRIVQQRDLLGVAKALDEFGEINQGWTRHTTGTMPPQWPRFSRRMRFWWHRTGCLGVGRKCMQTRSSGHLLSALSVAT